MLCAPGRVSGDMRFFSGVLTTHQQCGNETRERLGRSRPPGRCAIRHGGGHVGQGAASLRRRGVGDFGRVHQIAPAAGKGGLAMASSLY